MTFDDRTANQLSLSWGDTAIDFQRTSDSSGNC
ncbi:MAG: hypothetical protein ACJZ6C_05400 [Candidatus Poriferisodalaceae bacterium]